MKLATYLSITTTFIVICCHYALPTSPLPHSTFLIAFYMPCLFPVVLIIKNLQLCVTSFVQAVQLKSTRLYEAIENTHGFYALDKQRT